MLEIYQWKLSVTLPNLASLLTAAQNNNPFRNIHDLFKTKFFHWEFPFEIVPQKFKLLCIWQCTCVIWRSYGASHSTQREVIANKANNSICFYDVQLQTLIIIQHLRRTFLSSRRKKKRCPHLWKWWWETKQTPTFLNKRLFSLHYCAPARPFCATILWLFCSFVHSFIHTRWSMSKWPVFIACTFEWTNADAKKNGKHHP